VTGAELLTAWRSWQRDQGHRQATIDNYQRIASMWLRHLDRSGCRWQDAGPGELRGFLDADPEDAASAHRRRRACLSEATRRQYDKALRALTRFAVDEGLVDRDPFRRVRRPREPDPIPRALDLSQVRQVLDHIAALDDRVLVAVWLMYGAGLRRGEVTAARIEDVRLAGRAKMTVHGKGGKTRVIPLPDPVAEVLAAYLAARPRLRSGPLLESYRSTGAQPGVPTGRHLHVQTLGQMVSRAMRAAGVDETGHSLRHSFATELLAAGNGTNLRAVSRLLGHSSTAVTERVYTSSFDGDAQATAALLPDPRKTVPLAPFLGTPEVTAWRAKLEQVDPGLCDQIAACAAEFEAHAEVVASAMAAAGVLTTRFCSSFAAIHPDIESLQADVDREQVEDGIGVSAMWEACDQVLRAHPDN
jgi:integrase/recombinase XerD